MSRECAVALALTRLTQLDAVVSQHGLVADEDDLRDAIGEIMQGVRGILRPVLVEGGIDLVA
jgi:hypothetical protein